MCDNRVTKSRRVVFVNSDISRSRVAKIIALMQQTSAVCCVVIDLFSGSTIAWVVWDLRGGQISKLKV